MLGGIRDKLANLIATKKPSSGGSVVDYEEGVRKELAFKAWGQRRADIDEMVVGRPKIIKRLNKKTGEIEEYEAIEETGTSYLLRTIYKGTYGLGQIGEKYPITPQNALALRDLSLWIETFTETSEDVEDAIRFEGLAHAVAHNFAPRSVYKRDTDINVARLEPPRKDWKQNVDTLAD